MTEVFEVSYADTVVQMALPDNQSDYIQGLISSTASFYEQGMLAHMATLLRPDDLVIDVGAYIGNHSLFWRQSLVRELSHWNPTPGPTTSCTGMWC